MCLETADGANRRQNHRSPLVRARQFDRAAATHLLALQVDPLGDGKICSGGAIVVGGEGDLFVAGAAGERPVENFSAVVKLVPGKDAPFNRAINPPLPLLFFTLPPIRCDGTSR